jgi:peptidyl-prolyl cis-trans isomerase B (cyclophilin B)
VATNQMRREAAKRKLERQQERRAQQARRRRQVAVITSAAVVVVVLVGVVLLSTLGGDGDETTENAAADTPPAAGTCEFTATPEEPAAKPVPVPDITQAPTEGEVAVTLATNRGDIPLTLDRSAAPCTVESFVHLARADYFDSTPCHRLTVGANLSVLQCGDPTGTGMGGPGYTILDEPPTDLAPAPAGQGTVVYPRGTLAMAKTAAPDSGGSQFFLVYADSTLPPEYTVFGTIGEPGLAVLDQIAAGGLTGERQPGDGAPAEPVTITDAAVA